ncbi:hypothetical protein KSP39_PZI010551 [Platanthera zijinensis]|uniref:Uncharacterized protein n=1 Tax=Platanthera zijinensis TaxID=2320716 RepID=A0AAP0G664_9ASPA
MDPALMLSPSTWRRSTMAKRNPVVVVKKHSTAAAKPAKKLAVGRKVKLAALVKPSSLIQSCLWRLREQEKPLLVLKKCLFIFVAFTHICYFSFGNVVMYSFHPSYYFLTKEFINH